MLVVKFFHKGRAGGADPRRPESELGPEVGRCFVIMLTTKEPRLRSRTYTPGGVFKSLKNELPAIEKGAS